MAKVWQREGKGLTQPWCYLARLRTRFLLKSVLLHTFGTGTIWVDLPGVLSVFLPSYFPEAIVSTETIVDGITKGLLHFFKIRVFLH